MPVKIQELIIQTKIQPGNNQFDNMGPSKENWQQELMKLERRLQHTYATTFENWLRVKQER
jgi:hypothetical protein